ncbi:DUF1992 domain-containing protein [Arthrobacter roseus]|uniref:DnaJ family domain-containing protein n=1 Tax=Arthrobacter roseus TaxID=136274 RepID=UPI00308445FD|nr:hypothetical protein [Arthrobacter roseus]
MNLNRDEQARKMQRAAEYRAARKAGWEPDGEATTPGPASHYVGDVAAKAEVAVQEAQASGAFDNLEYAGKPLPELTRSLDPDWWVKGLIEREQLTGLAPAPFLLRKEDAELDELLDKQYSEARVRETLEEFNARVIEARRQLLGGPPVVTKLRDLEQELIRWRERRAARNAATSPPDQKSPERRRPWWRRRASCVNNRTARNLSHFEPAVRRVASLTRADARPRIQSGTDAVATDNGTIEEYSLRVNNSE